METGILPDEGLCSCLNPEYDNKLFDLIKPTFENEIQLNADNLSVAYWGSGLYWDDPRKLYAFTELRQTIVLFLAAMNGEL